MSASRSRRLPACRLWSTGLTVVLILGGGCRDRSPVSSAGPVAVPAVPSPLPPGPDKPASPAPTFPAGPRQGPLKVVRKGDREYLDRHGERLLICDYVRPWYDLNQRSDVVLAGGYRVTVPGEGKVAVTRQGTPGGWVAQGWVRDRWLKQDRYLGGHARANQARFMHQSGGGITLLLSDLVAAGDSALGIVSWRCDGPSGQPLCAQTLVRVQVHPRLGLAWLADLADAPTDCYHYARQPRLFAAAGRVLLHRTVPADAAHHRPAQATLSVVTPTAGIGPVVATLRARPGPVGVVAKRWLILDDPGETGVAPRYFDLRTRRGGVLPGVKGLHASLTVPPTGDEVLLQGEHSVYLLRLPDGRLRRLPLEAAGTEATVWHDLVLVFHYDWIAAFDLGTGKGVQVVKRPH